MTVPLFSLGMAGLFYAVVLPLALLPLFALLCIPGILSPGARASMVCKAAYCYVMMTAGVILMSVSGIPAIYAVIEKLLTGVDRFSTEIYVALLLVFAAGGLTFLWHETIALKVEEASRKVSASIFWVVFKAMGWVLLLVSSLSFFLTMLLVRESFSGTWWIMPLLLFLYGLLLAWVTRSAEEAAPVVPKPVPTPAAAPKALPPVMPVKMTPKPAVKPAKANRTIAKKKGGLDSVVS